MKILKTSQQAAREKTAMKNAFNEMKYCPECGHDMPSERISLPIHKHDNFYVYRAWCPSCGCEWESEEF